MIHKMLCYSQSCQSHDEGWKLNAWLPLVVSHERYIKSSSDWLIFHFMVS